MDPTDEITSCCITLMRGEWTLVFTYAVKGVVYSTQVALAAATEEELKEVKWTTS